MSYGFSSFKIGNIRHIAVCQFKNVNDLEIHLPPTGRKLLGGFAFVYDVLQN
jgi:hypothetical protein